MVSAAEAEELRVALIGVRKLVERDLQAFVNGLDLERRPEWARNALLNYVPLLVRRYGDDAAELAADWYDAARAAAGVPGRFRAEPLPSPYLDAVEGTVRRASAGLFLDEPDLAAVLKTLQSTVPKYVLAAPRQTITRASFHDPSSSGWQRITRAGACKFCEMLAGRGGVYTRETARFAAHGDCNCAAVPSWDMDAPEVDVAAYETSERHTS